MRKNKRFAILMGLSLMLVSGFAMAQATFSVDQIRGATGAADWSSQIWGAIFGSFAKSPFSPGSPSTLLGNLFVAFNAAIFAIGTAWLGYGVVSGIIGTTQDGQALGQRINSAWYPIRVVTGVAGMLPIMGGYTISQAMLMSVAGLGIGTANLMWTAAVQSPSLSAMVQSEALTTRQAVGRPEAIAAVGSMFQSHVCMQATLQVQQIRAGYGLELNPRDALEVRPVELPNGLMLQYGSAADPTQCGYVKFTMDKVRSDTNALAFRTNAVNYEGIRSSIATSLASKLTTLDSLVQRDAQAYMQAVAAWHAGDRVNELSFDKKTIGRTTNLYLQDANAVAKQAAGNATSAVTSAAQQKMLQHGWMSAGSFFGTFAEANAALADAVSGAKLEYRLPREAALFDEAAEEVSRSSKYVERAFNEETKTSGFCPDSLTTDTGNCSLGQTIVSMVIGGTMRGSGGGSGSGAGISGSGDVGLVNPIIGMKNVGDYVMTLASTLIAYDRMSNAKFDTTKDGFTGSISKLGDKVVAKGISTLPVIGPLMDELAPFGWMLLALGALLAIYVPFLPMIAWVGGMIAYTASFIEGLVAMPLHSMSHMHTDGEGLGQQTSHGYLFFLNTFARPPLMVISFFIASALVIALGTVVTMMFLPAMANVQGNSMTGVASIVGFIVVYFVLMNVVINGCFDLIHIIPDQVIGFVGSGNVSTKLGSDAETKIHSLYMAGVRGGQSGGQANIDRAARRGSDAMRDRFGKEDKNSPQAKK